MKKTLILAIFCISCILAGCGKKTAATEAEVKTEKPVVEETQTPKLDDYDYNDYVTLGEYKGITIEIPDFTVTDEDVESECAAVAEENATYTDTEKTTVEAFDWITATWTTSCEGATLEGYNAEEQRLCVGNGEFLKELEEAFIGLTVGEESIVTITLPEDFSDGDFAGKSVEVTVTVSAIQEKSTPEITDEWVATLGDYESVDAWKQEIRESLEETAAETRKMYAMASLQQTVIDACTFKDVPEELKEALLQEQRSLDESDAEGYSMEFEEYVQKYYGYETEDAYTEAMTDEVEESIKISFMLRGIADKEAVEEPSEEEYKAFVEKNMSGFTSEDELIKYYRKDILQEACKNSKIWDTVLASAVIIETSENTDKELTTAE